MYGLNMCPKEEMKRIKEQINEQKFIFNRFFPLILMENMKARFPMMFSPYLDEEQEREFGEFRSNSVTPINLNLYNAGWA